MITNRLYFLFIFIFLGTCVSFAQPGVLSPTPQSISWGKFAFRNTVAYRIVSEKNANTDALRVLKQHIKISNKGVKVIIGKKGDAAIRSVTALIPATKEGYYLSIQPNAVIIAGTDDAGTFYGVQTFLQILRNPQVKSVIIKDYPNVAERGVVEGFYGNPYSYEDRIRLFDFMGKNKMNIYIYGPKNDPYHGFGTQWREPYPAKEAADIKKLIDAAHHNKVNFVWAVHPGNNVSWEDKDKDGVVDDFKACVNKFEKMYDLGVRAFAVFFDDIGGIGTDATNQAKMMNYVNVHFVLKKHDVAPLIHCPTQYNEHRSKGNYLEVLRTDMDTSVRVMWTGKSVIHLIDKETMDWINPRIGRRAYIWWNYPVTDYILDRMLMGPVPANGQDIAPQLSGFVSNPMEYAEASKVALYGIADYCWNMKTFNAQKSWQQALQYLMPEHTESFKIFCENNQDLKPGEFIRNLNESESFKKIADPYLSNYHPTQINKDAKNKIVQQFESFQKATKDILSTTCNPQMLQEIEPWVESFGLMAQKGLILIQMHEALSKADSVGFITQYETLVQLDKRQSAIRSRDYKGSQASPHPLPANLMVLPFLKQYRSRLIKNYSTLHQYKKDIFPTPVIEEGKYFIKYNGQYLSNINGNTPEKNPVFLPERDKETPARQEWLILQDFTTDRFKILNMHDSKFLNENGNLGSLNFEAILHTFRLQKNKGKYLIQNAGNNGNKIWGIENGKIIQGKENKPTEADYIFEILSTNGNE